MPKKKLQDSLTLAAVAGCCAYVAYDLYWAIVHGVIFARRIGWISYAERPGRFLFECAMVLAFLGIVVAVAIFIRRKERNAKQCGEQPTAP